MTVSQFELNMLNIHSTSFSKDADKITEEETSSSGLDKDKKEKEEDIPSIPYYRLVSVLQFIVVNFLILSNLFNFWLFIKQLFKRFFYKQIVL